MQTILGASGQIGHELAVHLKRDFTSDIRLVSRKPRKVNDTDTLFSADLLDADQTRAAVEGADIVYLTAGLPMDTQLWAAQWPVLMRNVIAACAAHGARLELLPRYEADNIFVCDKFKARFPDFRVTTFAEGLTAIRDDQPRQK